MDSNDNDEVIELLNFIPKPKEYITVLDAEDDAQPVYKKTKTEDAKNSRVIDKCIECSLCSRKFTRASSLYAHKKAKHEEPTVSCTCCDKKFQSTTKRNAHFYEKGSKWLTSINDLELIVCTQKKIVSDLSSTLSLKEGVLDFLTKKVIELNEKQTLQEEECTKVRQELIAKTADIVDLQSEISSILDKYKNKF